ncbi:hypothetical protein PV326_002136 [Microctonus aethiopoides]|nr:hypothetical protein PV326_002136 [Microctonus aethiopoides]
MDKQNINLEKTLDSGKFKSILPSQLVSSRVCDTHLRNCGHKYTNTCICDHLIKLAKAHDKRLAKSCQNISQSSDSFHSIILAGSERCFSQKSSENSFHSAESTVSTSKLPITDYEQKSIIPAENSSKNNVESSKEIESSFVESCSSDDVLNENIDEKCKVSVGDDPSEQSDIDLNKAQELFKSTSTNDRNTNNNVDDSINTSNSLSNEDNLHFLLDNKSTTIYHDIPQFLKNYSALLHNEGDDTSKEVTRRLTRSFYKDPQEFAKRLMTIIEEPETNYNLEYSAISVDKLTAAFLKMCKYVEDESMPSMCNKSLLDRYETTQLPPMHPIQDNTTNHSLSQGTSTPIHSSTAGKKFSSKISPFGKNKNISNIQNSPLYISTLTRATGSPKTPIILESPGSTPGSAQNLNDSSFTFWEKKCKAKPLKINNNSAPILTDDEIKRFAKSEEQLRLLQAVDSPNKSPMKTEINIYSIQSDRQKSKNELRITLEFPLDSTVDTRLDAPLDDDENDMTESILYELAEKRKRCFETERTIRRIDAESSTHSNSMDILENEESVKILKYLTTLKDSADYKKFLMNDKIELSQQHCHVSKIDNRSLSQSSRISQKESKNPIDECSSHQIMAQSNRQHNITKRKPLKIQTPKEKSLDVNILKIGLSGHDSEFLKSNTDIKSPALMSRRVVSRNSVLSSISPIDSPLVDESIRPLLSQTNKMPPSLRPSTHTPRAKSPNLKVYPLNSYKSKSQLCSKTRASSSVTTSSSSNAQTISKTLSTAKLLTDRKSTVQLLTSNKGYTLQYMNSISRSRSPHLRNHGTLSKATKPQSKNKHCSNFCITPSAPSENVCKKIQHNEILQQKNPNTPMSSGPNKGGKFFNTPGKTPIPKIRPKPTSYFSDDDMKKSIFQSQYIDRHYNPSEVKSPVAEYIYGTDTTLIKNIRGKKNENLLTPKKKKEFSEQLEFKLTAKNYMENKPKRNHIFDYKVDSISGVNDENINDPRYNHPKVSYQLPNVIQEIRADLNTLRGSRARRLMEANDSRVIIKHAGRAIPQIRDVTQLDTSIHFPKSAEKQKFVFQPNYTEHH